MGEAKQAVKQQVAFSPPQISVSPITFYTGRTKAPFRPVLSCQLALLYGRIL